MFVNLKMIIIHLNQTLGRESLHHFYFRFYLKHVYFYGKDSHIKRTFIDYSSTTSPTN